MKRALPFAALAALALFSASTASAQQANGYAVNAFNPAEKGSDWFENESLDLRGQLRPAIGILGDYASNEILFKNYDGSTLGSVVSNQFYLHLGASLVIAERLRLGLNIPFAAYQNGEALAPQSAGALNGVNAAGATYNPPNKGALGDIRVGADLRLLGEYRDAASLAIGAQVFLPTGFQDQYTGDGKVRVDPRLILAGDLWDVLAYSARIGFDFRGQNEVFAGTQLGNQLTGGLAVGLRGLDGHLLVGPELSGATLLSKMFKGPTSPGELILGAHYQWSDWRVGLGAGGGIEDAYSSPSFRLVGGIEWSPGIPERDRDGDGIRDKDDACPDVPGVASDDPKLNGCPPAELDRDHDGVLDKDDACPDVPGVKTDDPRTNGCPPPGDRDGDGIPDKDDACPDVAGVKTDDPKTNGCPPDKDGDGVLDKDDACPDVPGVKTDDPKTNGCPAPADRDGDGILDKDDACPDVKGIPDPDPKKNGCPGLAKIENGKIEISEQVQFKTGNAQILEASTPVLTAVFNILKGHPEIKLIHIEGHTDNKGTAPKNMILSDKRAKAVMAWLVFRGIDASRMDAKGYGQERPIDSNSTDEGRAKNRRVEFHIEGPAGAPAGGGTRGHGRGK
jgi:outer membrane protein OmpA-like peptidoglycan-associated protein